MNMDHWPLLWFNAGQVFGMSKSRTSIVPQTMVSPEWPFGMWMLCTPDSRRTDSGDSFSAVKLL